MSLIIWKPAQYAQGFAEEAGADGNGTPQPSNGPLAIAPYDRDTVVREATRFTGWKKECFCDTGEFEVTTADVKPADVRRGNMVWLDGSVFVIEAYEWNLTENGYECTMSGRDFWRYPESEIKERYIGEHYRLFYGGDNAGDNTGKFNGENLALEMCGFLRDEFLFLAGWFRDRRRYPQAAIGERFYSDLIVKYPEGFTTRKTASAPTVANLMSYASEWRLFASWFNVGIRFRFAFDDAAGVFTIQPEIYNGEDNGVELKAEGRGVSGFKYSEDGRNAINAVLATWTSAKRTFGGTNHKYKGNAFTGATYADEAAADTMNFYKYVAPNDHQSYAERLELYSEKHLDMGSTPPDNDETKEKMMDWLRSGIEAATVQPEQSFEFEYDNSGAYKYGVHFELGDMITVQSDFLGIGAKQRLIAVTTSYEAGAAKSYAFEFGSQTIKKVALYANIARKLREIDMRTGTIHKKKGVDE